MKRMMEESNKKRKMEEEWGGGVFVGLHAIFGVFKFIN